MFKIGDFSKLSCVSLMREADPVIVIALRQANVSPEQVSARVEEMLRAREIGA